jgi:hypothetical protein
LSERIKDDPTNVMLGFEYVKGLTMMRQKIQAFEASSTMVRDDIYRTLTYSKNNGLNYHYAAMLATKLPKYYLLDQGIMDELNKYYDHYKIDKDDRLQGAILDGIPKPKVATGSNIEAMWRYIDQSRSVRGQDSAGCGSLTVGYYFGYEMSRASAKTISMAWDILNVCRKAGVNTVQMFSSTLPVNVISMLIHNGIYVVVMASVYPVCGEKDPPGLYSATNRQAITYLDYKFAEPVIKKTGITYSGIPPVLGMASLYFTYAYICPELADRSDIGYFPTTMPHQGRVIISNMVSSRPIEEFIPRCIGANYIRNSFLLHRRGFWRFDLMGSVLDLTRKIVVPSLSSIKTAKSVLTGIVIEEVELVEPVEEAVSALIIDKTDTLELNKSYRIASWASMVTAGSLASDIIYLKTLEGSPSSVLESLLQFAGLDDLLKAAGEYEPIIDHKEVDVPTKYDIPQNVAEDEEVRNQGVNSQAIIRDITFPDSSFE